MFVSGSGSDGSPPPSPPHSSDEEEDELLSAFENLTHAGRKPNAQAKRSSTEEGDSEEDELLEMVHSQFENITHMFWDIAAKNNARQKIKGKQRQENKETEALETVHKALSNVAKTYGSSSNSPRKQRISKKGSAKVTNDDESRIIGAKKKCEKMPEDDGQASHPSTLISPLDSTRQARQIRAQVINKTLVEVQADPFIYKLPIQTAIHILFLSTFDKISHKIPLSQKTISLFITISETLFYTFNDRKIFYKFDCFIQEFEKELSKEEKEACSKEFILLKRLQLFIKCAHFDDVQTLQELQAVNSETATLTTKEKKAAVEAVTRGIRQFSKFFSVYFERATEDLKGIRANLQTATRLQTTDKRAICLAFAPNAKDEEIQDLFKRCDVWSKSLNSFLDIYFIRHTFIESCLHNLGLCHNHLSLGTDIESNIKLVQQALQQLLIATEDCYNPMRGFFSLEEEKVLLADLQWFPQITSNMFSQITSFRPFEQTMGKKEEPSESYYHESLRARLFFKHSFEQSQLESKSYWSEAMREQTHQLVVKSLSPPQLSHNKMMLSASMPTIAGFRLALQVCAKGLKSLEYLYTIYEEVAPREETRELSLEESLLLLDDKHTPSLRKKAALKKRQDVSASKSKKKRPKKKTAQSESKESALPISDIPSLPPPQLDATKPQSNLQHYTFFAHQLEKTLNFKDSPQAKEALANAAYHLQVLGTTLDMLQSPSYTHSPRTQQAILYRLVRSSSLFFEQVITALYKKEFPNTSVNHYPIAFLKDMNRWDNLPQSLKSYAETVNYGAVIPRYPNNVQNRFQSYGATPPLALQWLLNPASLREAASLITGPLELIQYLLAEGGNDCAILKQTHHHLLDFFENIKPKAGNRPLPLTHKWQPVIEAIESALSVLSHIPSSNNNVMNLLDIRFSLEGLKGEIELLIAHPETVFLASHVDPILTRLQFCDELLQETLHLLLFDAELRTHDLQDYRTIRHYQESPEDEKALADINIKTWAQYPFRGLRKIRVYNQKNQIRLSIPKAIALRLQSTGYSYNGEDYDAGFTPAKGKKQRAAAAEKGPQRVVEELHAITRRLLAMEKTCLEQILHQTPEEAEESED